MNDITPPPRVQTSTNASDLNPASN